jgi:GNAT superfamily N-acetyltransferase
VTPYAVVQAAGAAALPDLLALRLAWKPAANPQEAEAFTAGLTQWWTAEGERRRLWLARHTDGSAVGMANATVFTRMPVPGRGGVRWLYVSNVFVREEHRRVGVGRALMDAVVGWARAEELVRVVLAPSELSVPFYRDLGFRPAHDLMRLDLGH